MTKISNQYSLTNILTADLANSRLGINNVSPTVALDVTGAGKFSSSVTNAGLIFNTNDAVFSTAGSITKHSVVGLVSKGVTGSVFDFSIYSASGTALITNPTGTNNLGFSGGPVTFSSSIYASRALFDSDFLQNETSKVGISFASGYGQINSWGANTSTYGGFKFQISVSNGGTYDALKIAPNGAATFAGSVMVNGSTVSTEGLSVQYNQAKTYTTQTAVSRWHSNESSGSQFKLNLFAIGNATGSSRVFSFQTSNEGVANDGIISLQAGGGNVLIGTTTGDGYKLQIVGASQASATFGQTYAGVAAYSQWITSTGVFAMGLDTASGTTERMRITSGGFLLVGNTNHTDGSMFENGGSNTALNAYRQSSTGGNGIIGFYSNVTSTKNIVAYFKCDGGLANYSGNNVNLSDERTKNSISSLDSYWDKFKAIEIVKFKYNGQSHDNYNIGVIAQQVEKVAPEFVSNDGWGINNEDKNDLKAIYESDLHHTTIKVLQEAMIKIEELSAKVSLLENK